MKTLLFLNKGCETMELSVFVDVLGWARNDYGLDTQVVTCGFQKQVISTFGIPLTVDLLIDQVQAEDFDAIAVPGGFEEFGFYEEAYDERFLELLREFDRQGKVIASVCVGALPLGKSGVLRGRRGTTYHLGDGYRQKMLGEFGVEVVNESVVIDGNIITSYCPETAAEVAFQLLEKLTSHEDANTVRTAMGYRVNRKTC